LISTRPAEALCQQCGLCCNGALFADVKLHLTERPAVASALASLPPPAVPLGQPATRPSSVRAPCKTLGQPCPAFDGRLCRIYAERPQYCRDFECALLKRFRAGRLSATAAAVTVRSARKRVTAVSDLLRRLGDTDETSPLAARFHRLARRIETSLPEEESTRRFGKLTLAMHALNQILSSKFYPGQPD